MQAREKSKAHVKIFTTEIKIKSKILTGLVLALLFYCGSASAELAYLCFIFLRFWLPGPARRECGYLAKPGVHYASYRQPKQTNLKTSERQAAYNLHYVNIALGPFYLACLFVNGVGAALVDAPAAICAAEGRDKKHDRKTGRRDGVRWPCIYVGNYVSFYIDQKLKLWH